ncbi:hypothetical protein BD414DRAFT_319640 [Trametes punicea]|nr:hypothetical protein BD414DRAFT_319640 [Trametes punicea]
MKRLAHIIHIHAHIPSTPLHLCTYQLYPHNHIHIPQFIYPLCLVRIVHYPLRVTERKGSSRTYIPCAWTYTLFFCLPGSTSIIPTPLLSSLVLDLRSSFPSSKSHRRCSAVHCRCTLSGGCCSHKLPFILAGSSMRGEITGMAQIAHTIPKEVSTVRARSRLNYIAQYHTGTTDVQVPATSWKIS